MIDKVKSNQEDIEVINKCLSGDTEAFGFIQKKYIGLVTSLIRRMIKVEEDVQDLVQETFIKAYNALASYQTTYSFSAWLYRIASNNCIDFHRKKRVHIISLNQKFNDSDEEEEIEIEDQSYMPDIGVINEDKRQAIIQAMSALPENYRQIIQLRHEEDLDYNEIAEKLNIPLGTVKAHLFRARRLMYDELKNKKYLFT